MAWASETPGRKRKGAERLGWVAFYLVALWGCGPSQLIESPRPVVEKPLPKREVKPPEKTKPLGQDSVAPQLPFLAQAEEATEELAYQAASRRLLVALMDDEKILAKGPYSDRLIEAVHFKAQDYLKIAASGQGIAVTLGLEKERLRSTLERMMSAVDEVQLTAIPSSLVESLRAVRGGRIKHLLCKRARRLVDAFSCDDKPPTLAEHQLGELLDKIRITSLWDGGIPATENEVLRPLILTTTLSEKSSANPIEALPLRITHRPTGSSLMLQSDQTGRVVYTPPKELGATGKFYIEVDVESLLDDEVAGISAPHLTVSSRRVGFERAAVAYPGRNVPAKTAAGRLQSELRTLFLKERSLKPRLIDSLYNLSPRELGPRLEKLADEMEGQLDLVVMVEAESEFASRMGTHRVWFEARGKAVAYDVWTGQIVAEAKGTVTESGVGESRAELSAQEALGKELANKLRGELKKPRN